MAWDYRKARRHARGSGLKEELRLVPGLPEGQGSETGTSENGTKRQQLGYPCHECGNELVRCSAKEDWSHKVHEEGSREELFGQMSTTDWLSQWNNSFFARPPWTLDEAGKSYGVQFLPWDGAIWKIKRPGTIEPLALKIDAKTKASRSIG